MIEILSQSEIYRMQIAGERAATTLRAIESIIKPGISTLEIDKFVRAHTELQGCRPAPLGYRGANGNLPPFPAACCTSVNNVVCHGIPGPRKLRDGDIVNVDITSIYLGYHGDTSRTFMVGTVSDDVKRLVEGCYEAMMAGIQEVKPGARLGDIGAAIEEVANRHQLSVVTSFVGHGIGRRFHTLPNVPHYGKRGTGLRIKSGMCFTIEPMLNLGEPDVVILDDQWTAVTQDGSLSAQFEETILVTDTGHKILTSLV